MLIMNVTIYQHLTDRKDEEIDFDWDFLSWEHDRKRTGRRKKVNSKQMCVSSQNQRMRKEEGATVAATPYLLLNWLSHQAGPAAFYNDVPTVGKSHKLPKMSY